MFANAKGKHQQKIRLLHCQEQRIDHIPSFRDCRACTFLPITFLKIAAYENLTTVILKRILLLSATTFYRHQR